MFRVMTSTVVEDRVASTSREVREDTEEIRQTPTTERSRLVFKRPLQCTAISINSNEVSLSVNPLREKCALPTCWKRAPKLPEQVVPPRSAGSSKKVWETRFAHSLCCSSRSVYTLSK